MEWTREKTMMLIEQYKERRGLWDMTCDDYRKKDVKQKLLNEVRDRLGGDIPVPELEKKFHTLRTQYHREISRMKRKEPYNSKWFGFKNLQFLSSPHACRSNKGRIKSEITEDGTVTKFVISEPAQTTVENSGGSVSSSNNNINEEFLTMPRKTHANNRAHELEKLIEETTKDVEDIEDAKPKLIMKEINVPFDQNYAEHVPITENESLETQQQQQQQQQSQQTVEEIEHAGTTIESVSFQANENGELHFQSPTNTAANTTMQQNVMSTRIYKLPRRDGGVSDENYYNENHQQLHHSKRIFYDTNSHNTAILSTPITSPQNGSSTLINPATIKLQRGTICVGPTPPKLSDSPSVLSVPRDEFTTYGEYVANEMRAITNREVLNVLKHKINTAIFEANMAEFQK